MLVSQKWDFGELTGIGSGQSEWMRQDILGGPGQQIFIS